MLKRTLVIKQMFTLANLFFLFFNIYGQDDALLSKHQAIGDIDFLVTEIKRTHPAFISNQYIDQIDQKSDELIESLAGELSVKDLWKELVPFINSLKDGHTHMGWFFDNSFIDKKLFPFETVLLNDTLYLHIKDSKHNDLNGGKIISVNGHSINDLLDLMFQFVNHESKTYSDTQIEKMFSYLYYIIHGTNEFFTIKYSKEGNILTDKVCGVKPHNHPTIPNYENYTFSVLDSTGIKIGYLELNNCKNLNRFKSFLDDCIKTIDSEKISKLVIDIRKNSGGSSEIALLLLDYLISGNYHHANICFRNTKEIKDKLYSSSSINPNFLQKINFLLSEKYFRDMLFHRKGNLICLDNNERKNTRHQTYEGDVYVLCSNITYSAAISLAAIVKAYNRGMIIGEPCSGLLTGYTQSQSIYLPNSGLRGYISEYYFVEPSNETHKHIIPDIIIKPTLDGIIDGRDEVLDATVSLILTQ